MHIYAQTPAHGRYPRNSAHDGILDYGDMKVGTGRHFLKPRGTAAGFHGDWLGSACRSHAAICR